MSRKTKRNVAKKAAKRAIPADAPLSILNVGQGDTKVSFDPAKPAERKRACKIVTEMLQRGYAILVQAGEKDGKPIFYRATSFDPETAEYIVAGMPEEFDQTAKPPKVRKGRQAPRLPAETTRTVAVARSAGGMSMAANSIEARNGFALLNHFDGMAGLRDALTQVARETGEWAGIPMPLEDCPLVVEPRYPKAAELMAMGCKPEEEADEDLKDATIVNRFYSTHRRCDIVIFRLKDGTTDWGLQRAIHGFDEQLQTLGNSDVWGIQQEAAALQTLASLVRHRQFKQYLLTGAFIERSARSGKSYVFRKLRPTVVLTERDGQMVILTALCMHPIAYYQGSWAGALCPTDDVVAHLMLMRGCEEYYWKVCNQHPAHRPEAGL